VQRLVLEPINIFSVMVMPTSIDSI
jgi:hypothetical protein